jgi:type I restriction enzyme M protein
LTPTEPIDGSQLPDFLRKQRKQVEDNNSWVVEFDEETFEEKGWDLTARNPNRLDDYEHVPALDLVRSIRTKEERITELLGELEEMLEGNDA